MLLKNDNLIRNAVRQVSMKPLTNGNIQPYLNNRNPRNLERLRLERKPTGYSLENVHIEFWHKLLLSPHKKYVVAQIMHYSNKIVVEASTNEWSIYKHLYSKTDRLAYIVLAKIFAERCLETGLYSFACDIVPESQDSKAQIFMNHLVEEGLTLSEMPQYNVHNIYYKTKEKKPWTVLED